MSLAQALFAPRAVALVGASGDAGKNTARPQRYLRKHGYAGRIFPINKGRKEILGEQAYETLAQVPGEIDHAYIMVEDVEAALEDCGRKKVPLASIYSNGFADAGAEGAARQARLVERAKALGVRLLGPNSMGVVDLPGRLALTVNAVLEMDGPPAGTTSLVSQSGTMLGTVLSRGAARGLGFSKMISVGNEADLGVAEVVGMLAEDPGTRVILLFLETVRDAPALAAAARKAHAAGKPVAAYKLGRSRLGGALAQSHTGAMAGEDAALDAFFRACGILRVDMLETLIEIAPLLVNRVPGNFFSRKPRVAVVTTTGGGAASVVDRLGLLGIDCVAPDSEAHIIDLTMTATRDTYRQTLDQLLAWQGCDAVLSIVGSSAQFHPQLAVEPIIRSAGGNQGGKPLAAFLTPHAEASLALLAAQGVPAFRTPEACADAMSAYFSWRAPRAGAPGTLALKPGRIENEAQALDFFAQLGVPCVERAMAQAPSYLHAVPYPVAAKKLGVAHKTDAGGVRLGVPDFNELRRIAAAWKEERLLVQRMEKGLAEAIVGYRDDPVVGPVVLVGAGGTLAELYNDYALGLAPVTEGEAEEMIALVKGLAVIRGYRNMPRGDVKALARAVAAFSRIALMKDRPIAEAEINPIIVKADGVVAVDGLVVMR